jgi:hypothetical protein
MGDKDEAILDKILEEIEFIVDAIGDVEAERWVSLRAPVVLSRATFATLSFPSLKNGQGACLKHFIHRNQRDISLLLGSHG